MPGIQGDRLKIQICQPGETPWPAAKAVSPGSNFDRAGPLTEAVRFGHLALRSQLRDDLTQMKLLWDAPSLKFSNSEEANKYLRREYRPGWTL